MGVGDQIGGGDGLDPPAQGAAEPDGRHLAGEGAAAGPGQDHPRLVPLEQWSGQRVQLGALLRDPRGNLTPEPRLLTDLAREVQLVGVRRGRRRR